MDIPRQKRPNRRRYVYIGVAITAIALVTLALSRLEPAAPTVERSVIFVDTVQRGPMVRQVRGPGNLVPEDIRWITTLTQARVERIHVRPGTVVKRGMLLLELSNPDVNIQALQAEQALTAAEARLVELRTQLETQRLNQEAVVATATREYEEALRQVRTNEELARDGLVSVIELENARGRVKELQVRLEAERERLRILTESIEEQLAVQREQVERLRAIAEFQREQVESLRIRAMSDGVLQRMDLEVGQWVVPGNTLGAIVQPGRLKAELRIPETQIKDVTVGQPVEIDTRNGIVPGRVLRIDPSVVNGTVTVEVALEGELPRGARPDLSVDGTIEVERLEDVLFVGRPAYGQPESRVGLFKLTEDGSHAVRVPVRLGRASVNTIEIVEGLQEGDVVILSDMSAWEQYDRIRIK
ncbi:MAG TPA: HlyD family efflux transporter periplasmic adaptor subunit [Longimicrobiales bacterium]